MMCRIGADASKRALSNCPVIAMISRRIFLPLFPLWVKFTRSRSTKYGPQVWPPKMGLFKLTYLSLTVASGHERLTMLTMSSLHVVILGLAEEKCCSFLMWFHSDFRFRLFWVCVRVCVCVCVCVSQSVVVFISADGVANADTSRGPRWFHFSAVLYLSALEERTRSIFR